METTVKTKSNGAAKKQAKQASGIPEPKRISKAGQWRRDNPGGIGIIIDRRAVNR